MSEDKKKIKMLVIPSDKSGCGYYRSLQPHTYIQENYGDEFDIDIMYDFPNSNLDKFFSQYDIVHIHKSLDKELKLINMMKFVGCKVIVDVDDHWKLGNDHPMSITAKTEKWHEPIINHLKLADIVTTTTDLFKKEILPINKNVEVFPNAINPNDDKFKLNGTKANDRLRFGIICGSSHLKDLELLKDLTPKLSQDTLNKIQFVLCGFDTNGTIMTYDLSTKQTTKRPIEPWESVWYEYEKIITDNYRIVSKDHELFLKKFIKNVDYPNLDEPYRRCWTKDINHYYQHYDNIDVLLVPLKENNFNMVKSELKCIEAGFAHKAIIANNFGPYTICLKSIIDGNNINEDGNALLIDSSKNHKLWAKYITRLVNNRELLTKLQNNLYNTVKDTYSLDNVCKKRVEVYKKLVNS